MDINYRWCGDYLIPDLTLNAKAYPPLGKYGRMREWYLREHRHLLYSTMLLGGRLDEHLHEIDAAAQKRMDQLMRQMAETAGITEELKACNPMRWVGEMNAIKAQAEEMILEELIYSRIQHDRARRGASLFLLETRKEQNRWATTGEKREPSG